MILGRMAYVIPKEPYSGSGLTICPAEDVWIEIVDCWVLIICVGKVIDTLIVTCPALLDPTAEPVPCTRLVLPAAAELDGPAVAVPENIVKPLAFAELDVDARNEPMTPVVVSTDDELEASAEAFEYSSDDVPDDNNHINRRLPAAEGDGV